MPETVTTTKPAIPKHGKKEHRKEIEKKLAIALVDYKKEPNTKKFDKLIKKASKILSHLETSVSKTKVSSKTPIAGAKKASSKKLVKKAAPAKEKKAE